MSLISAADRERLQADFAALTAPVRLLFFTQTFDCDTCTQARQIIDDYKMRKRNRLVGTLARGSRFLHVVPDDPRMQHHIIVPPPKDVGRPANEGDKVVVEILAWQDRHSSPEGEIVEVLGAPDAP